VRQGEVRLAGRLPKWAPYPLTLQARPRGEEPVAQASFAGPGPFELRYARTRALPEPAPFEPLELRCLGDGESTLESGVPLLYLQQVSVLPGEAGR